MPGSPIRPVLRAGLLVAVAGAGVPHAQAARPPLTALEEGGIHLGVPDGWDPLVDLEQNNALFSQGMYTHLTMYWFVWRPGVTPDVLADSVWDVMDAQIPFGTIAREGRSRTPDGLSLRQRGTYRLLGYGLTLGLVARTVPSHGRAVVAILVSDPDGFDALDGFGLVDDVVEALDLPTDPPGPWPDAGFVRVPDGLRRPPEAPAPDEAEGASP